MRMRNYNQHELLRYFPIYRFSSINIWQVGSENKQSTILCTLQFTSTYLSTIEYLSGAEAEAWNSFQVSPVVFDGYLNASLVTQST